MTTSLSLDLSTLLSQCKSLHSGVLSLDQLAAAHQTLCQCTLQGTISTEELPTTDPESLDPIIQLRCQTPQDKALCQSLLLETEATAPHDAERLLALQYLMFPLSLMNSLRHVLIPFLLTNDESSPTVSEDLGIALLEQLGGTQTEHDESISEWSTLLSSLVQSRHSMAGRLLVRLLQANPTSPQRIQAYYDKLWQTLNNVKDSPPVSDHENPNIFQDHPGIYTISKDLLPVLTSSKTETILKNDLHKPHVLLLWTRLFSLYTVLEDDCGTDKKRMALLLITTVLCPLLPHVVDYQLPHVNKDGSSDNLSLPVGQPVLWDLIHECLEQGKSLLDCGVALSSILRKRGLFLLNTVATSPEWKQYVVCVETLEMECEPHLVDQIWDSVSVLVELAVDEDGTTFGVLTWRWMSLLFSGVLSSEQPAIRKLGMYRFLKAQDEDSDGKQKQKGVKRKGKKKTRNIQPLKRDGKKGSMLEKLPPDFFLKTLLPSWNSLGTSVGYNMHLEINRKVETEDMVPMMTKLLRTYVRRLDPSRSNAFWKGLWDWSLIQHLSTKTVVLAFQAIADEISTNKEELRIPADDSTLMSLASMMQAYFLVGSVVLTYRKEVVQAIAIMLAHTHYMEGSKEKWKPLTILHLLALFSAEQFALDSADWNIANESVLMDLRIWVSRFEGDATGLGAAVATAFVDGQLQTTDGGLWHPRSGSSSTERELGWAIPLLCSLAADESKSKTGGALLWPAIHKGLSHSATAILTTNKADHVTRALLLLENGCRLRQLSGLGNGDLVLDKDTQQMLPPPPNIEKLLSSATDFIAFHMKSLVSLKGSSEGTGGARSEGAKQASTTYTRLVSQLRTLQQSYPSSDAISSAMGEMLKSTSEGLIAGAEDDSARLMLVTLIYAAVSTGANPGHKLHLPLCEVLLKMELTGDTNAPKSWEQMARSVLHYSKWAAISCILPMHLQGLGDASDSKQASVLEFVEKLLRTSFDAVEATPVDAVVPLFDCILSASRHWLFSVKQQGPEGENAYTDTLEEVIRALSALMKDAAFSQDAMYMLNEFCALIFDPKLMKEEYERFEDNPECKTPIRDAFRALMKLAGDQRPHINRAVLSRATVGWLGNEGDQGLSAIPYREDIAKLLLHKEAKMEESALNQSQGHMASSPTLLPPQTSEYSLTRAFILVFFAKLPNPGDGLNEKVLRELVHQVILSLLTTTDPVDSTHPSMIMKGTPYYCRKMRAWQALCILSRFVTVEIAQRVCDDTFRSMPEPVHNQIRFFIEIFTIKCATLHPDVFGDAFLSHISRRDLTLQHISSLMIMGGNWIVGKYKTGYFEPDSGKNLRIRQVLAAVIPWLSSTQGFSRAIAQLLVYALIPMVLGPTEKDDSLSGASDWFLEQMYTFLDENKEMVRLRKKQLKFFERYDVEEMCTPEGIMGVPVDEGDEADPIHLVDTIKDTLVAVYEEAHGAEAPVWKQIEEMVEAEPSDELSAEESSTREDLMVNFQRKIIPLDSLNLAMESQREKKLRNGIGAPKQQLIVCASLIDKVPNLGGLARTAEIFAADRLVVPDKSVCQMDHFKGISVGAVDWIDIEEVREEALLQWLLEQKSKGYFVFGLEQTSSSISLTEMEFPDRPTILLLGKEKEGIPVELLQAVDQCVEIPQLGIIRSLNVHNKVEGSDGGSVHSYPSIRSKEWREPTNTRNGSKGKLYRDESPASSRKTQPETPQKYIKTAKKVIEELHKASEASNQERRIIAITNACGEFDHADDMKHNAELQHGAASVLAKVLSTTNDDDEIRMVCAAIEMVFRAQSSFVHVAFDKCGSSIIPILLRLLERAENGNMKHADVSILNITKTLLHCSRVNELRFVLARQQGMLEVLQRVATSILNPDCRVARVRIIANLANCEDNKVMVLENEGMLDSLLRIAHLDLSDTAREYAGMALMDLASAPANQVRMAQDDKLLGTLVKMVLVEKVATTREAAITALQNLAYTKENRTRLAKFKNCIVLEALKKALSGDKNDKARRRAAGALTNLACDETAETMGGHKGLLNALAIVSTKDDSKEVQTRAAMALTKLAASITIKMSSYNTLLDALVVASLSLAANSVSAVLRVKARDPDNRQSMARHSGVLDTLADICINPRADVKDKDNAMRAIMHLTNESNNRQTMCNKTILEALVRGASETEPGYEEIRDSAVRSMERLATEFSNRAIMARHDGLLVAIAKATEREAKLEEAGAKADHAFLAKPLLMSLLVAM